MKVLNYWTQQKKSPLFRFFGVFNGIRKGFRCFYTQWQFIVIRPEPAYHGVVYAEAFGPTAYIARLACHPASTTHRQMTVKEQKSAGVTQDLMRLCVGIEHIDDILADLEQAFKAANKRK